MTKPQENKMGVWPENKLLLNMSVPIMISMLVQALYNIVDSLFVSWLTVDGVKVGETALSAVTLAFPFQNLMIAVAVGTGVGINALLSRSLGEKRQDKANTVAMQGILISFVWFLLFVVLGLACSKVFIGSQTQNAQELAFGTEYLMICTTCSLGLFMQVTMERLLQATGRTMLSMVTQGVGALVNIILDPIFIFGWLGIPQMGVAGAAIATVIGQLAAAGVGVYCNLRYNRDITLRLNRLKPNLAICKQILIIGIPSIVMSAIGSVMTYAMNKILEAFAGAVAVFGVYFKLQSFAFMPVFGLNNGMVPIIAYNLGAKKRSRITKTIRLSIIYASSIMLLGLALMQLFPGTILGMFDASEQMIQVGVPAFQIISLSFIFAGASIVMSSVCQAVGKSIYSMFVSIGRQLVVLVPAAILLAKTGNATNVFFAFPIAEIISFLLCIFFLRKVLKSIPHYDEA